MDRSSKFVLIVMSLFALPFLALGGSIFVSALRRLVNDGSASSLALMLFGFLFVAIGAGLLLLAVFGPGKVKQAERRHAEHPNEPWLWRDDWAEGYARSTRKSNLIVKCLFATFWNLVSTPIVFLVPKEVIQQRPVLAVAFLFPAIGVVLIVVAFREILRRMEFGNTSLQLASVPCVIGREFRGAIHSRFPHSPDHGVRLKLSCFNRVTTGSGNTQSTNEKILWQDEVMLSGNELYAAPTGTSIPVSFHLPADAPSSDTSNVHNSIVWLLTAEAEVPGVDYKDGFELPVFRTANSPAASSQVTDTAIEAPQHPTILLRPAENGGKEFYFPAARNPGFAASVTAFGTGLAAAIWFMCTHHVPFIFPLVFSLFELILIYASVQLWLGTSSVTIGSGAVRVRSGFLDGGIARDIPFAQITAIRTAIIAQQGDGTGTPYYDIQLLLADGKPLTVGRTIRNKHEAEWLVSEMKNLIGLGRPKAMAAAAR